MSSLTATNSQSPNSGDQSFVPFGHPASFSQRFNVLFSFSIFFIFTKMFVPGEGLPPSCPLILSYEDYCRKSGVPGIRAVTARSCLASYGPLRFRSLVGCGGVTRPHPDDILNNAAPLRFTANNSVLCPLPGLYPIPGCVAGRSHISLFGSSRAVNTSSPPT